MNYFMSNILPFILFVMVILGIIGWVVDLLEKGSQRKKAASGRIGLIVIAFLFPPVSNPNSYRCRDIFDTFSFLFNLNTCKIDFIFWLLMLGVAGALGHLIYKAILDDKQES